MSTILLSPGPLVRRYLSGLEEPGSSHDLPMNSARYGHQLAQNQQLLSKGGEEGGYVDSIMHCVTGIEMSKHVPLK